MLTATLILAALVLLVITDTADDSDHLPAKSSANLEGSAPWKPKRR